jgi:hypothetical protein
VFGTQALVDDGDGAIQRLERLREPLLAHAHLAQVAVQHAQVGVVLALARHEDGDRALEQRLDLAESPRVEIGAREVVERAHEVGVVAAQLGLADPHRVLEVTDRLLLASHPQQHAAQTVVGDRQDRVAGPEAGHPQRQGAAMLDLALGVATEVLERRGPVVVGDGEVG